jgi:hypothetical protein
LFLNAQLVSSQHDLISQTLFEKAGRAVMHWAGRPTSLSGRLAIALLLCALPLVAAGCRDPYRREHTGLPPHPTRGQVLVDGQPAQGVNVRFVPVEGVSEENPAASGRTDEEGNFELSTYNRGDGVPAGEYKVLLSWVKILDPSLREEDQPPEAQRLPWKYQDPKHTELKVTIEEGSNELEPLEASTNDDTPRPEFEAAAPGQADGA